MEVPLIGKSKEVREREARSMRVAFLDRRLSLAGDIAGRLLQGLMSNWLLARNVLKDPDEGEEWKEPKKKKERLEVPIADTVAISLAVADQLLYRSGLADALGIPMAKSKDEHGDQGDVESEGG